MIPISSAIAKVTAIVAPHYAKNDPGHSLPHANAVFELALELAQFCNYARMDLVAYAAYLHDVQVYVDRKHHHTLARQFVESEVCDSLFTNQSDRAIVAAAVGEHRASYFGEFTSELSEIVSSADRMHPLISIEDLFARIVKSMRHRFTSDEITRYHALIHLQEKFGRNGYVRYPPLYRNYFAEELEQRYLAIEKFLQQHQH